MRGLSPTFMYELQDNGMLAGLRKRVIADKDLDLQIREGYLNIYYKGSALLKLTELPSSRYRVDIHAKFLGDLDLPDISDEATAQRFLDAIPQLKQAIITARVTKASLEVEYEQLIIRANNLEPDANSEYFFVDRQYARGAARFDLIGVCWPRQGRKRNQKTRIAPCFLEIKFAQNNDIREVHDQLNRYYTLIKQDERGFAQEIAHLFKQKLELGLFKCSPGQLEAMKTLHVTDDIKQFQFIVVLVDFNPFSDLFKEANASLATLEFADQIRIFNTGFAMWQRNLKPPAKAVPGEQGESPIQEL
jgi:hypothetical protein